jgi:sodium-dependent dicarboxylate transporter 2/3/5
MIAVPTGAILGGFATPAGNGLNVMVMQTVESIGGTPLTFLQWSIVGIPIVLIMVIVCSLWIKRFCRLENEHVEIDALLKRLDTHEPLSRCDIKFMTILSIMVILWVVSSWVPALNITLIAIAGVFVMHLPGIQLLKGKEFLQGVSWETFIVCGGIIALGTGVQGTGAIQWVVNGVLGSVEGLPFVVILLALSIIPCVVHMITPAAGSIFALTCAPLVTAAIALNIDPCIAGLIVGIWVCITFTQPFDLVYLLTYSYGYYTSGELVRYGVLPTLLLLALSVTLLPALCLI